MKTTHLTRLIIVCCITVAAAMTAAAMTAAAQDDVQTRNITSDDLNRPQPVNKIVTVRRKPATYHFVRTDKSVIHRSKPAPKTVVTLTPKTTDIGVTMWKMRPPKPEEINEFLLPVKGDDGKRQNWLVERVDTDTIFKAGDKVRFAVESSHIGYLYVFDREMHLDGSLGEPSLIFPETLDDDNSVKPGMLVDFPDQHDEFPYFKMAPHKGGYSGELLTVIISPKPLTGLKTGDKGKLMNIESLTDLEAGSEAAIFTRTDTIDSVYSKTESESACGIKTRDLEREKVPDKPCGVSSHLLTKDEPHPQSIYRVKGFVGQPAVAFVKLSVK